MVTRYRQEKINHYSLYFVGLAGISFVLNFLQSACFGTVPLHKYIQNVSHTHVSDTTAHTSVSEDDL